MNWSPAWIISFAIFSFFFPGCLTTGTSGDDASQVPRWATYATDSGFKHEYRVNGVQTIMDSKGNLADALEILAPSSGRTYWFQSSGNLLRNDNPCVPVLHDDCGATSVVWNPRPLPSAFGLGVDVFFAKHGEDLSWISRITGSSYQITRPPNAPGGWIPTNITVEFDETPWFPSLVEWTDPIATFQRTSIADDSFVLDQHEAIALAFAVEETTPGGKAESFMLGEQEPIFGAPLSPREAIDAWAARDEEFRAAMAGGCLSGYMQHWSGTNQLLFGVWAIHADSEESWRLDMRRNLLGQWTFEVLDRNSSPTEVLCAEVHGATPIPMSIGDFVDSITEFVDLDGADVPSVRIRPQADGGQGGQGLFQYRMNWKPAAAGDSMFFPVNQFQYDPYTGDVLVAVVDATTPSSWSFHPRLHA